MMVLLWLPFISFVTVLLNTYLPRQGSHLVLVPSQKDAHHPWTVYPQPPFQISDIKVNSVLHGFQDGDRKLRDSSSSLKFGFTVAFMSNVFSLFSLSFLLSASPQDRRQVHCVSDPATLAMNGVCVGMTSTDILFHLSARAMFRG